MPRSVHKMIELVKGPARHSLKVIASAGGSTLNTVLPSLARAMPAGFDLSILVINLNSSLIDLMPDHWKKEVDLSVSRLRTLANSSGDKINVACWQYDYVPCVRGVIIDNQHLFLGFFVWEDSSGKPLLSGAEQPHLYYRREPQHDHQFRLFDRWFTHAPRQQVIP